MSQPTLLRRYGARILFGGLSIGIAYAYFGVGSRAPNPLRTPGVQNIERAYRSGGATSTHTKAYGGTVQGQKESDELRPGGATGKESGFQFEGIGTDQKSDQPGKAGQLFNEMKHGVPHSK